jgi:asparagine synthase (glutamine-hydrolysing)
MCGVVGIFRYGIGEHGVDPDEVLAIRDAMTTRGPDGAGTWFSDDRRVALAHRRLAIIGLGEQGAQPMELRPRCSGEGGSLVVTFNGEIYNYREVRRHLKERGHHLTSQTDTEVLLHLYEEYGSELVGFLRGMYAFALFDGRANTMLLARDPLGIKPLYLADDGETVRVASQTRALLRSPWVSDATSDAALAGILVFGNIPETLTAWSDISTVPSGSTITIQCDGSRIARRFFSISEEVTRAEQIPVAHPVDELVRDALSDSVKAHMVSDVEVGVFLSGGIDSSAVLGLAAANNQSLHAVTIGFDDFVGSSLDEVPFARVVADTYGARHRVDVVTREDFSTQLPAMLSDMDQPSIDGLNSWLVARAAASQGLKVALSGLGGDEFLGGYSTFVTVPSWYRRLRVPASLPRLGRASRRLLTRATRSHKPKAAGVLEYGDSLAHVWLLRRCVHAPWELPLILGHERAGAALAALDIDSILADAITPEPRTDVGVVAALEGGLYLRNQLLRDADWAGMAHSLEIRVPFVDSVVFPVLAQALTRAWKPPAGKQSLGRAPSPQLPTAVLTRSKTGFSVPMAELAVNQPDFSDWRRMPILAHPKCSWARRWSYVVACQFEMV